MKEEKEFVFYQPLVNEVVIIGYYDSAQWSLPEDIQSFLVSMSTGQTHIFIGEL